MDLLIAPITFGLFASPIMDYFNMKYASDGVNYYAEVHTTTINKFMHFIFMTFTLYGILLWFSMLIALLVKMTILLPYNKTILLANRIKLMIFIGYVTHYLTFNLSGAIISALYAFPSLAFSVHHQWSLSLFKTIIYGLLISTCALGIQEYFGHYHGNDPASRPEAVHNAIVYAPYFAANSFRL